MRKMIALGYLNKDNAPTPETAASLPTDLESPSADKIDKTVVIFHDESTFQANEDQKGYQGYANFETQESRRWNNGVGLH